MRTLAFVLFVVVTTAAAILGTLAASRYLSLEKKLAEVSYQLEETQRVRKAQEEEKMALRLERERVQSDLEARLAEQKNQLDDCSSQNLRYSQEILGGLLNLQHRMTDLTVQLSATAPRERTDPGKAQDGAAQAGKPSETEQAPAKAPDAPSRAADVKKGAVPTPAEEAKKLDHVQ